METIGLLKDGRTVVILNKNEVAFLELASSLEGITEPHFSKEAKPKRAGRPKGSKNRKKRGSSNKGKVPKYLRRRKKLVHQGVEFTRKEAAEFIGIGIPTLNGRIYRGWTDDALFESVDV